ncbi:hypothetical protein L3X38_018509 [Prunus dulcis]|uniref:Uncharacterized protein n=1 Tax=Prunus dulcis TaxID=3755 RepID=A0AAD4WBE7_PRUDU|nr:hypothetical protein L3X38_018509 [Prunus dulcis]
MGLSISRLYFATWNGLYGLLLKLLWYDDDIDDDDDDDGDGDDGDAHGNAIDDDEDSTFDLMPDPEFFPFSVVA